MRKPDRLWGDGASSVCRGDPATARPVAYPPTGALPVQITGSIARAVHAVLPRRWVLPGRARAGGPDGDGPVSASVPQVTQHCHTIARVPNGECNVT